MKRVGVLGALVLMACMAGMAFWMYSAQHKHGRQLRSDAVGLRSAPLAQQVASLRTPVVPRTDAASQPEENGYRVPMQELLGSSAPDAVGEDRAQDAQTDERSWWPVKMSEQNNRPHSEEPPGDVESNPQHDNTQLTPQSRGHTGGAESAMSNKMVQRFVDRVADSILVTPAKERTGDNDGPALDGVASKSRRSLTSAPGADGDDDFAMSMNERQDATGYDGFNGESNPVSQVEKEVMPPSEDAERADAGTSSKSGQLGTDDTGPPRRCRPRRDPSCRCSLHCHECEVAGGEQVACRICRNEFYLNPETGLCIVKCPAGMREVGSGAYNRRCVKPELSQLPASAVAAGIEGNSAQRCVCKDCLSSACICNPSGPTCAMCDNFKVLLNGQCTNKCPDGFAVEGRDRIGRRCKATVVDKADVADIFKQQIQQHRHDPSDVSHVSNSVLGERRSVDSQHQPLAAAQGLPGTLGAIRVVHWGLKRGQVESGTITVAVNTIVRWVFDGPHNVVSGTPGKPDGKFSSGPVGLSQQFQHTFSEPGVYPYFCSSHSGIMRGVITVQGSSAGQSQGAYKLVYRGKDTDNPMPLRFETAVQREHILFEVSTPSLEQCQSNCDLSPQCKGVFFYRRSLRCRGLSNLGANPKSTGIQADSYAKVDPGSNTSFF